MAETLPWYTSDVPCHMTRHARRTIEHEFLLNTYQENEKDHIVFKSLHANDSLRRGIGENEGYPAPETGDRHGAAVSGGAGTPADGRRAAARNLRGRPAEPAFLAVGPDVGKPSGFADIPANRMYEFKKNCCKKCS